jgi:site-specific DNA recombinase
VPARNGTCQGVRAYLPVEGGIEVVGRVEPAGDWRAMDAEEGRRVLRLRGREYLRVSYDPSGVMKSTTDQHADNATDADREGIELGEPFVEEGARSASRFATKERKGFDDLVAVLEAGRFGAEVLYLWESSRGSRKVREWVSLIDACETAEVRIRVTTHGRTYDPVNPRDRRSLLEDAVDAEYEVGRSSLRIRRGHASSAKAGKPGGRAPYGYVRSYDPRTRAFISQDPVPEEAAVVRELFDRLYRGHSFRRIERDFQAAGIRSRDQERVVRDDSGQVVRDENGDPKTVVIPGRPFSAEQLRTMALNPAYAGLRVHHGQTYQGQWKPLVKRAVWSAVQKRLKTPESTKGRSGRGLHLLSYIVPCGCCDGPLSPKNRDRGGPNYHCKQRGCVRVNEEKLDAYIEAVIFGYLRRPDVGKTLLAASAVTPQLDAVREEIQELRQQLDDLYERAKPTAPKGQRLSPAALAALEPDYLEQLALAERREKELAAPDVLAALLQRGDLSGWPDDMPLSARRDVCRLLLVPERIGRPQLARAKHSHAPVGDRIKWQRSTAPVPSAAQPLGTTNGARPGRSKSARQPGPRM